MNQGWQRADVCEHLYLSRIFITPNHFERHSAAKRFATGLSAQKAITEKTQVVLNLERMRTWCGAETMAATSLTAFPNYCI
jgi:hypothetical protein